MSRLHDKYKQNIVPAMKAEFKYTNVHQIPRIQKVVLNSGTGRASSDAKFLETASVTLGRVTGQAPVATVAKHSVAGFKLRQGQKIGATVTLRGERMYEFLDRLVSVVLPRIRDFRGISRTAFDPQGNYSLGITDHTIFPEIPYEDAGSSHGLQVNIVTTAKTSAEGLKLLELMGFPFKRSE